MAPHMFLKLSIKWYWKKVDGYNFIHEEFKVRCLSKTYLHCIVFTIFSEQGTEEVKKLLLLLLGCAVQVSLFS